MNGFWVGQLDFKYEPCAHVVQSLHGHLLSFRPNRVAHFEHVCCTLLCLYPGGHMAGSSVTFRLQLSAKHVNVTDMLALA